MNPIVDSFRVAWIDMRYIRHNLASVLVTSLAAPLLYLFAFGYGLGSDMGGGSGDYISFVIPGVIAMTTMTACFSTVATKVMVQRTYYESFNELYLCSISPTSIILGKCYAGMMRGLISCTVLYGIGLFLSSSMTLNVWAALFIVFSCAMYSMLGVVCGMLTNSHIRMNLFNSIVILPMTFLGGTIFSLDNLSKPVQIALQILPLTETSGCMRSLILDNPFPWMSLIVLFAWTMAFFLISRHVMIRRMA